MGATGRLRCVICLDMRLRKALAAGWVEEGGRGAGIGQNHAIAAAKLQ